MSQNALPDHPDLALFVATLFQRLGGSLTIDADGRRQSRQPDFSISKQDRHAMPVLPDSRDGERFRNEDEWRGAIKLMNYWLSRLSVRDRDYIYTLCADLRVNLDEPFDFKQYLN
jgi:hypothetical protein